MKKRIFCPELYALIALALLLSGFTALERQQQRISDHMIRLHVVADSNTAYDQSVKLSVRDAILLAVKPLTESACSVPEARQMIENNIETLENVANDTLKQLGVADIAKVTLQRELFEVRHYDSFSLPGGYYDALRVTIGSGEGRNWWCVVYPGICTAATMEDQRTLAVMAGMNAEDFDILTQGSEEYIFKFKLLELFEELMGKLRPYLQPS